MNALFVLLTIATILYMLVYQPGFYKFYFGLLIPYYIFTQLFFNDSKINSSKKKFFISSWLHPFDSQIYCSSTVDITNLLSYVEELSVRRAFNDNSQKYICDEDFKNALKTIFVSLRPFFNIYKVI